MTSTDLDTVDERESSIDILPPARPASAAALATLRDHAEAMQIAHQLATAMVSTSMVPDRFRGKADDAAAAILYGSEIGLNPIQSLQNLFPVGGSPSMYARTMVALLKSHGYSVKTVEESPTVCEVHGWQPGKNPKVDDADETSSWTIERARTAEFAPVEDPETGTWKTYTKKNGDKAVLGNMKYVTQPQEMLWAKAAATVCRRLAPDVLLGIAYSTEELESERERVAVTSERGEPKRGGKGVSGLRQRAAAAQEPVDAETVDYDGDATANAAEATEANADNADPRVDAAERANIADTEKVRAKQEAEKADKPVKSAMRKALEKRLFALLGDLEPALERADRLIVYRAILGRDDVNSTNDLDDVAVAKVADQLYQWGQDDVLAEQITDIVNTATLAAEADTNDTEASTS